MISFGGAFLEDVSPVRVISAAVGPAGVRPLAHQLPGRGARLVRVSYAARQVIIRFVLTDGDAGMAAEHLMRINEWAGGAEEKRLTLPGCGAAHLMAVCTELPSLELSRAGDGVMRLRFTAFDPFWRADAEKSSPAGEVFIGGSAPPLMRLTCRVESAGDVVWRCGGVKTRFADVPPGCLTVDLNDNTAELDGVSVINRFDPAGAFIKPQTGRIALSGPGRIIWRERWL